MTLFGYSLNPPPHTKCHVLLLLLTLVSSIFQFNFFSSAQTFDFTFKSCGNYVDDDCSNYIQNVDSHFYENVQNQYKNCVKQQKWKVFDK